MGRQNHRMLPCHSLSTCQGTDEGHGDVHHGGRVFRKGRIPEAVYGQRRLVHLVDVPLMRLRMEELGKAFLHTR